MASNSSAPLTHDCAGYNDVPDRIAVACLYSILFPFALLLNGVAAWVSLHLPSTSSFIVYLKNLVAADLLMTLMLPLLAASKLPQATLWLRAFNCRYSSVIFYSSLYTSITLMGLISLDRFFKVVRPRGRAIGQSVAFSLVTSSIVWLMLFVGGALPTIILTDQSPENVTTQLCMSMKSPTGVTAHAGVILSMELLFLLVSVLVVVCYVCITMRVLQSFRNSGSNNSQGKKKTKLRVFLILLVFFVCFVPIHIIRIPTTLHEVFNSDRCSQPWMKICHMFCLWLSTTNTCMDPLLYIYLCREYRDKLVDMLKARGISVGRFSDEKEETSQ